MLRTLALSACVAFVAAVTFSKVYWGYWLWRPTLDSRILEVRRYLGVSFIEAEPQAGVPLAFVEDPETSVSEELERYRRDDYTYGDKRVLEVLDTRGALSTLPLKRTVELHTLLALIQGTDALAEPEPGYAPRGSRLYGLALEAEGHDGSRLLFLGLHGGEVSNDHYPAYEFLFQAPPGTERFEQVSVNRWFIDVAGVEGAEWYFVFLFFFPLLVLVSWLGLGVYAVFRWGSSLRRVRGYRAPGRAPPRPG
jgi:hypothetical protein